MSTYRYIPQGEPAIDYIEHALSLGGTLARLVQKHCDLRAGSVYAFLPTEYAVATSRDYIRGGVASSTISLTHLTEVISHFLDATRARICLFENALARATDPWLAKAQSHLLLFDEEVLHLVTSRDYLQFADDRDAAIRTAVIEAERALTVIGVCSLEPVPNWRPGNIVSYDELERVAEKHRKLIVGAFDGESYLVWTRQGTP